MVTLVEDDVKTAPVSLDRRRDIVLLSLPDWVDSNPKMYFPLSLMYLASVISRAGYDVEIFDGRTGIDELPKADFYGFSCATPQIFIAKELAQKVDGVTIIGGAHASLLPNDCVKHFDYVVAGEGEEVILDILQGNLDPGIIRSPRIQNLDKVPFPAWDMVQEPFSDTLFPGERYGHGKLAATLIGSRGCPFNCSYCGNVHTKPVIYRSANNIIAELKELMNRGVRHFRFEDDNFTILPEFDKLCDGIEKLSLHYKCHTRSDLLSEEKAQKMAQSGCEECGLGVESADNRVLEVNNKRETAADHLRAISILKKANIRVKAYFVMGLPGETDETLRLNKQFVKQSQIDKWTVATFCPYPGCPVFKAPGKFNIEIINKDYSKWWNYIQGDAYNHIIIGQTSQEMWARYKEFYRWLKEEYNEISNDKRTN